MAQCRFVKTSFFIDESNYFLNPLERLALIGLVCISDPTGCFDDRPYWLRANIFPYNTELNFEEILTSLCDQGALEYIEPLDEDLKNYYQFTEKFLLDCCESIQ